MKALVAYDSVYGNTEQIAKAIGSALGSDARLARVGEVDPSTLEGVDVLVIGSPTLGGRASEATQALLSRISEAAIKGKKVAAFDTRLTGRFVKMFGYAADRIAQDLVSKGATLLLPPEPFYVMGKKGPLKEGELDRAANWAKQMSK